MWINSRHGWRKPQGWDSLALSVLVLLRDRSNKWQGKLLNEMAVDYNNWTKSRYPARGNSLISAYIRQIVKEKVFLNDNELCLVYIPAGFVNFG